MKLVSCSVTKLQKHYQSIQTTDQTRSQPIQSTGGSASEFGRGREISREILNAVQNGKQVICGL